MLECPDFFLIKDAEGNEKWVIGFCHGCQAVRLRELQRQITPATIGTWTWRAVQAGNRVPFVGLQATITTRCKSTNDGKRQIVYGWMSLFVERFPMVTTVGAATHPCRVRSRWAPTATCTPRRWPKWKACARIPSTGAIDLDDVSGEKIIVDEEAVKSK